MMVFSLSKDHLYAADATGHRVLTDGTGDGFSDHRQGIGASRDGDMIEVRGGHLRTPNSRHHDRRSPLAQWADLSAVGWVKPRGAAGSGLRPR